MRKGHKLGVVKMFLFFFCGGEFSFVLDSAQKRFGAAAFPPGKPRKNAFHPYLPLPFAHQIDRVPPPRRFIPPPQRARSRACRRLGARGVGRDRGVARARMSKAPGGIALYMSPPRFPWSAHPCPCPQKFLWLQIVADVGRPLPTCLLCFVPADCWVVNQHFFLVCLPLTML